MSKIDKTVFWYFEAYSGSLDFEAAKKEFEMLPEFEKEKIKNEAAIYFDNMGFDYSKEESIKNKHRSAVRNYSPKDPKKILLPEIEKEFDSLEPSEQKNGYRIALK